MDRVSLEGNHINKGERVHHPVCLKVRVNVVLGLELHLR